ncbi:hypothetical protein TNCV_5042531 [Trichonephila clavipes]|nr:hypothetical protein TNCV_5042531 [Trichonephila clavipes]
MTRFTHGAANADGIQRLSHRWQRVGTVAGSTLRVFRPSSPPGSATAYQLLHRSINRHVANMVLTKEAKLTLSSTFRYVSIESP